MSLRQYKFECNNSYNRGPDLVLLVTLVWLTFDATIHFVIAEICFNEYYTTSILLFLTKKCRVDWGRFGFHYPFVMISHLHLHVISPVSEMGFFGRLLFRPNSYWFVTVSYIFNCCSSCQLVALFICLQ